MTVLIMCCSQTCIKPHTSLYTNTYNKHYESQLRIGMSLHYTGKIKASHVQRVRTLPASILMMNSPVPQVVQD